MNTTDSNNTQRVLPITEKPATGTPPTPATLTIRTMKGRTGSSPGVNPTTEQRSAAVAELVKLQEAGANTSAMVRALLDKGWTVSAICSTIVYGEDARTGDRKAGEPLRPQHVHQIKTKWEADRNVAAAKAQSAPKA